MSVIFLEGLISDTSLSVGYQQRERRLIALSSPCTTNNHRWKPQTASPGTYVNVLFEFTVRDAWHRQPFCQFCCHRFLQRHRHADSHHGSRPSRRNRQLWGFAQEYQSCVEDHPISVFYFLFSYVSLRKNIAHANAPRRSDQAAIYSVRL